MAKSDKKAASPKAVAETLRSTETAVVLVQPSQLSLPAGIKVKKLITVPSLVLKTPGEGRALYIVDAMRISKIVDKKDTAREPATICTVGDVTTGETFTFLVPAVVKANLERDYPNDSYVGLTFYIQNMGKRTPSQRYNDFSIAEVEVEKQTA